MKKKNNKLILITAPSCGGKTTLQNELLKRGYSRPINFTTRKPRNESELDEYVFINNEERYHYLLKHGYLLEHTNYNGNWYGVSATLPEGDVCIVLDPVGRDQVMEKVARKGLDYEVTTVFLEIDEKLQNDRLRARGDSKEDIKLRNNDFKWIFPTTNCKIVDGKLDPDIIADKMGW